MKKKALEMGVGDTILLGGTEFVVEELEQSEIGKQGTKKIRIVAKKSDGSKITIIRPADYLIDVK